MYSRSQKIVPIILLQRSGACVNSTPLRPEWKRRLDPDHENMTSHTLHYDFIDLLVFADMYDMA